MWRFVKRWNVDFQKQPYTINQPLPICIVWCPQPEFWIPNVKWNECLEYLREYKFAKLGIIYAMNVIDIDSVMWYGQSARKSTMKDMDPPTPTATKTRQLKQRQAEHPQVSQKSWTERLIIEWFRMEKEQKVKGKPR